MLFARVQDATLVSAREVLGGGGGNPPKKSGFAHKCHHPVVETIPKLDLERRWAQSEAEFRCQERQFNAFLLVDLQLPHQRWVNISTIVYRGAEEGL